MKFLLSLLAFTATVTARAAPQPGNSPTKTAPGSQSISERAATGFVHPGIFVDSDRLSLMASKVAAKAEPWNAAYSALAVDEHATRTSPTPFATVNCGPTSTPNIGCSEETSDSLAAYANALLWATTKDKAKADRAISFMNAWARTIKAHENSNKPLQAAWAAANWVRAAEIIRHTDAGWSDADIATFEKMLRDAYLPLVKNGSTNPNNWELSMLLMR